MSNTVRLRFAPSPTGELHLGGARTALFNFLFVKKHLGDLVLRIEDTDQARFQEGAMERFMADLDWLGIKFDEDYVKGGDFGPYIQSGRTEIYKNHARELIEKDGAYYCFCTSERLDKMRADLQAKKQKPSYDRTCRNLSKDEVQQKIDQGDQFVVRLKAPLQGEIVVDDLVRGEVKFGLDDVDDAVLVKSDGFPTYHLANVIDDHLMQITHVLRAEEWLPSTPKHLILYQNFGWSPPRFAHLPLLLAPDKKKLSKRVHGEKVWVGTYREQGYLPEALVNYLALLGWSSGDDHEFFSLDELIEKFDMNRVQKSGAIFDEEKLNHFQGHYIREMELDEFLKRLTPFKSQKMNDEIFVRAATTIKTRIVKLADFAELTNFFVSLPAYNSEKLIFKKSSKEKTTLGLNKSIGALEELGDWQPQAISDQLSKVVTENNLTNGDVFWAVRVALTGEDFSPPPNECAWILGKDETLQRLKKAILFLGEQ